MRGLNIILVGCLMVTVLNFHLNGAEVIEKVGDFMKKRTKFGDVYLHREHEDGEEV
jgi:hypothetical protein